MSPRLVPNRLGPGLPLEAAPGPSDGSVDPRHDSGARERDGDRAPTRHRWVAGSSIILHAVDPSTSSSACGLIGFSTADSPDRHADLAPRCSRCQVRLSVSA
jgi:hypothetical protein